MFRSLFWVVLGAAFAISFAMPPSAPVRANTGSHSHAAPALGDRIFGSGEFRLVSFAAAALADPVVRTVGGKCLTAQEAAAQPRLVLAGFGLGLPGHDKHPSAPVFRYGRGSGQKHDRNAAFLGQRLALR